MPAPRSTAAVPSLLLACVLWPAAEAAAQQNPQRIGEFQSWTAATHAEGEQKVCYAFTRATRSEGVPNRASNDVLLVVTHREKGRAQVAIRPGYAYPRNADGGNPVQMSVGGANIGFYTAGASAFARDNKAAVAALRNGREAVARGPVPNGRGQASDTFALSGFSAALDAISRECPASAPASTSKTQRR
jgi:invasion protein IalB